MAFPKIRIFLYIAFDVRDDSLISKPGKNYTTRLQDHFGIIIDARPKTEPEVTITSNREKRNKFLVLHIDSKHFEEAIAHHHGRLPEGVYFTGVKVEKD